MYIYIYITESTITSGGSSVDAGLITSGGLSADAGLSGIIKAAIAVSLLAVIALTIVIITFTVYCIKHGKNIIAMIQLLYEFSNNVIHTRYCDGTILAVFSCCL